jgi:hypothetical protein
MPSMTILWRAAAISAVVAVPVLGMSMARADTAPTGGAATATAGSTDAGTRLAHACDRLPHRIERLEKVRTRFHADAGTRGSIAFLEARISKADAGGHADLTRLLRDRLAVRKDIDSQLPDVLANLKDAQQVCQQHGSTAGATS